MLECGTSLEAVWTDSLIQECKGTHQGVNLPSFSWFWRWRKRTVSSSCFSARDFRQSLVSLGRSYTSYALVLGVLRFLGPRSVTSASPLPVGIRIEVSAVPVVSSSGSSRIVAVVAIVLDPLRADAKGGQLEVMCPPCGSAEQSPTWLSSRSRSV